MPAFLGRTHRSRRARRDELDVIELRAKVAHEVFAPLTNVVGHLEFVCDGDAGPLSAEQQSILEIAARSSRRLSEIVHNLLELTTVDPAMIIGYLAREQRLASVAA